MKWREIIVEMRPGEERDNLDPYDSWLAKFCYENLDKWPSQKTFDLLCRRYPVEEPTAVFRGMNFSTKEDYDDFMTMIADGVLDTNGTATSWGRTPSEVENFALTRPSYILNRETMQAHDDARRRGEVVTGYRGLILRAVVGPGQGIDVNKSRVGHESEIITRGKIAVTIEQVLKTYQDLVDDEEMDFDAAAEREDTDSRSYHGGMTAYVRDRHVERLSAVTKSKLFQREYKAPEIKIREEKPYFSGDLPFTKVTFSFPYYLYRLAASSFYNEEDCIHALDDARTLVDDLIRDIRDRPQDIFRYTHAIVDLANWTNRPDLKGALQEHIRNQYKDLEKKGRDINKLPGEERLPAIHRHGEVIKLVLSQLEGIS